ncbi:Dolichyl-diphosphooligosaccharide--protein glycosyltransferase subunit WBP1 [Schizophyllum amplum]|uniref:Dolichyl-diphosphooligosaccharide--protein glycosyltransferase subunit WBP1 n=1 Tax=Schizophyllum amplum TaxID=97359 RepID=A0A550C4W0_9AGAR|nr:Dolichyl-diphosphooligosaccharide--protein glycosyltransferase subunit WBP1 [Auriculariopsis ampla]
MRGILRLAACVLGLLSSVIAKSSTGDSVLVVVDPDNRDFYNTFFTGLTSQGYQLTFRAPKDEAPLIIADDYPTFAHVIYFAPETKTPAKDITPQALVSLAKQNTNLIIALSPKQTPISALAAEFSLVLPPPGTPLVSHFPERDTPRTVVPIAAPQGNSIVSGDLAPIWFSGVPFALGSNPLLVPVLQAPAESFASDVETDAGAGAIVDAAGKGGEGLWAGSSMGVVAGFQVVDGGRVTWVGGTEMFSDEFAQKELPGGGKPGNERFVQDVARWTFQESMVLRIDETGHHLVNATEPKQAYTTNDDIVFTAKISKFNPETDAFEPFSDINDMQLEFTMLDPHVRTALPPVPGQPGTYSTTFRAPDRHGVFKFVVDYKRKGWTHLHSSTTVPVVPPRHDEYPRFLSAAWPYYTGAISTSVAFFLFSAAWLASDTRDSRKGKAKAE